MGIENVETQFGNVVKAYDMERTICDIIKYKKYMDIQVFTYALKEYVKNKNKNINKLIDYAKKLRVEDKVRNYMKYCCKINILKEEIINGKETRIA